MNAVQHGTWLPADAELEQYGEFLLSGDITPESAVKLSQSLLRFAYAQRGAVPRPPVVLTLFSVGGSLDGGFHIAATLMRLREMGFEIYTRIQGGVYSTAFLIAQFGTHRQMDSSAMAHIHTIQFTADKQAETLLFEDQADRVAKRKQIMAETLARRNTMGEPYNKPGYWIEHFMQGREHHFTAWQCLNMGLVDEVVGDIDLLNPSPVVNVTAIELVSEHSAA